MAEILFIEGFTHYRIGSVGRTDMDAKNWVNTASSATGAIGSDGRFVGSNYYRQGAVTHPSPINSRTWGPISEGCFAGAIRTSEQAILIARSETTERLTLNVGLGDISVVGTPGTLISVDHPGTGTVFNHYAVEFLLDGSAGYVRLYVNGFLYAEFTGNTGTGTVDNLRFRRLSTAGTNTTFADITDIYVATEFLGDARVLTRMPNANGHHTGLTPEPTADNYTRVNSATIDDDTYNFSDTPGDKDTYVYPDDLPVDATVLAVSWAPRVVKDDAGARTARHIVRTGTTDHAGSDLVLSTSHQWFPLIYSEDPDTTFPWEVADLHAAEFGVEVRS